MCIHIHIYTYILIHILDLIGLSCVHLLPKSLGNTFIPDVEYPEFTTILDSCDTKAKDNNLPQIYNFLSFIIFLFRLAK